MSDRSLKTFPIHLGRGATATRQPRFTGQMQWYMDYGARTADDGTDGFLVSMFTFTEPWDTWEMHPEGHEVVICTTGTMTLIQEVGGEHVKVVLRAGDAVINPPGVWHTCDVAETATGVFLTAGVGTRMRPR